MDTELTVDAGLRLEFIDESLEMLSGLEPLFVDLEADPENAETVQAIFRPIHSIKGNSSFFDFPNVKTLSHEMETVLDLVRQKHLGVSAALIGAELAGVDMLKTMLERGRRGEPEVHDRPAFEALVEQVKKIATREELGLGEICHRAIERLRSIKLMLSAGVDNIDSAVDALIGELAAHIVEAGPATAAVSPGAPAALARLTEILQMPLHGNLEHSVALEAGECLRALKGELATPDGAAKLDVLLDNYNTFMDTLGFDDLLQEMLRDGLKDIEFKVEAHAVASAPPPAPATEPPAATRTPAKAKEEAAKTMRVSEQYVDTFLSYVGELLVVRDMFNHLETRLGAHNGMQVLRTDFRRINETFATLSDALQKSIMSIRLVAVGNILQRVPRLVRDVAAASGKEIDVKIEGEKIEVDKSLVDLLEAPLTHMVRNAADHGIEPPDTRVAAGKPRAGSVKVSVIEMPNNLSLLIEDDGAGLDLDRIQKKAVELGIVAEGQRLTEEDVVNFLFQSGVSTASEVTDISGRGVGMDVVKRMVEEAGGTIHVSTQRGRGSKFEVVVPKTVTTQIVSGFLVESGRQRFVFPMTKVLETTRLETNHILTVATQGRCFKHHNRVIPLVSMDRLLELDRNGRHEKDYELVVTLAARQGNFGVAVDQVLGVQQVVLRHIRGLTCNSESIAGGALMGDGTVALIIDVDKMHGEFTASATV
jgi:two-component system chemotaxis sensor kinase CheA